jgi:hypothetical protein
MLNIESRTEIIFHFNKMSLQDPSVPMWVIKAKGQTYYVDHVDMESGVGFSTKETPDNPSTKGSIKFKGKLRIDKQDNRVVATIYP